MRKHEPSRGEIEAWKHLRALCAEGFAFRRKHQIGRYWADFIWLRRRLIVEIDGPLHESEQARTHDAERDAWLRSEGYVMLRLKEAEILSSAYWLGKVRNVLLSQAESSYRKRASPHPLPLPL